MMIIFTTDIDQDLNPAWGLAVARARWLIKEIDQHDGLEEEQAHFTMGLDLIFGKYWKIILTNDLVFSV